MGKRTLIVNGSPRPHGNTVALIEEMKKTLEGGSSRFRRFARISRRAWIAAGCVKTARCVVRDEMDTIYADDYDNVVIATPVYFGTMPAP